MANLSLIKTLMREKKITYGMLSQMTGLTAQGVCQMIRANKAMTDNLELIANALGVPVGYFFEETPAKTSHSDNSVSVPREVLEMLAEKDKQLREKDAVISRLTERLIGK